MNLTERKPTPQIGDVANSLRDIAYSVGDVPDQIVMPSETMDALIDGTARFLTERTVTPDHIFGIPVLIDDKMPRGIIRMVDKDGVVLAEIGRFGL